MLLTVTIKNALRGLRACHALAIDSVRASSDRVGAEAVMMMVKECTTGYHGEQYTTPFSFVNFRSCVKLVGKEREPCSTLNRMK